MKRMVLLAASLLLATPLLAAEEKPAQKKEPAPAAAQTTTAAPADGSKLAAEAPAAGDSPLVALAKRSPKTPKKGSIVITNANLGGQNAKVTTTASQKPLATGAAPKNEEDADANQVIGALNKANEKNPAAAAAAKEKAPMSEADKAKRMEAMRSRLEDDSLALDDGDPARVEHQLEKTAQTPTQTQTAPPPKKP